jgi:hypothetical protein
LKLDRLFWLEVTGVESIYGKIRSREDELREKERDRRKKQDFDSAPDSMDMEKERSRAEFLNRQSAVFKRAEEGLNTTKSVFDSSAIFHTDRD